MQEDLLVKENKKFVKLKDAYALEVEKYENLSKSLIFAMIQFLILELKMLV
jgi:hypothetical protein